MENHSSKPLMIQPMPVQDPALMLGDQAWITPPPPSPFTPFGTAVVPSVVPAVAPTDPPGDETPPTLLTTEKTPLGTEKTQDPDIHRVLTDELPEAEDPELDWGQIRRRKTIPIAWKAVAVLLIAATIVQSIVLISRAEKMSPETLVLRKKEVDAEKQKTVDIADRLEHTARSYLAAQSIQEKVQWVRHPERVEALMTEHYLNPAIEPDTFLSVKTLKSITLWSKSFILMVANLEGGSSRFLVLEQGADNTFKVDWETDVYYLPMTWPKFAQSRIPQTLDMRVRVKPDHHYHSAFSDQQQFSCFRMVARDDPEAVFGYVKKGSPAWHDLRLFFSKKKKSHADGEPLILRLRIPDERSAQQGVVIEKFLSDRWLYVDPPSRPARQKFIASQSQ